MSVSANSRAIDVGFRKKRCTALLMSSSVSSTGRNQGERESWSQAESGTATATAPIPASSRRRLMRSSLMAIVSADAIAPGDHRTQIVADPGDQHHHDVDHHEQHYRRRHDEMDGARRLP